MPLSKIEKKVETIEATSDEIVQKVEDLKETIKDELKENTNFLHEAVGPVDVYKDIIRSNRQTNLINAIAISMLGILVIILTITLIHNEKEFTTYRENSVKKGEIIEIIKEAHFNCEV